MVFLQNDEYLSIYSNILLKIWVSVIWITSCLSINKVSYLKIRHGSQSENGFENREDLRIIALIICSPTAPESSLEDSM